MSVNTSILDYVGDKYLLLFHVLVVYFSGSIFKREEVLDFNGVQVTLHG